VAKQFVSENGGEFVGEELVPTDATDFSPYLLKIRQARPDVVASNLAGNQITNFIKQYAEYGLDFPICGFGFDTAVAWGAGEGNFSGIWPLIWHHLVDTPASKKFVEGFKGEVRQAAREPGLGRLQRPENRCPVVRGAEINGPAEARRAFAQGRKVRRPEIP
jgi:amino acid/amide ABC transporter substrate-binding protein, HAAT family (TC 3.A.1.4.-)